MTSSCVAVEDWTTTFWGGDVGTRMGQRQNNNTFYIFRMTCFKRLKVSRLTHMLHSQRRNIPASPTNTSCGGLLGPSPTALYTLRRIS